MKTRREFLKIGAALATGTFLASACKNSASRNVPATQENVPATLNLAFFGLGWMGMVDLEAFINVPDVRVVALCDPDARCLEKAQKMLTERGFSPAETFSDYRKVFKNARERIDASVIATPDHSHFAVAMEAIAHKKHVFVEKPLCRTISQVRRLAQAAREARIVTQMGNQGQVSQHIRTAREWIEAGALGEIEEIHAWTNRPVWPQGMKTPAREDPCPPALDWDLWLGDAPARPYSRAIAPFFWRGWLDYGTGALGDMALHVLNPANYIFSLGVPEIVEAEAPSVTSFAFPESSKVTFHFPAVGTRRALKIVWFDGKNVPARPRDLPAEIPFPQGIGGSIFYGTKDTMMLGSSGEYMRLLKNDAHWRAHPPARKYARLRGNIYRNWIEAIRTGSVPASGFDYAAPFTETILLGVLAQQLNCRLEWDATRGTFKKLKTDNG